MHISREVVGRRQDDGAVQQELDPVGHDLSNNEQRAQMPERVRRVEVERVERERDQQEQVEQRRDRLQEVRGHRPGAPDPRAHLQQGKQRIDMCLLLGFIFHSSAAVI